MFIIIIITVTTIRRRDSITLQELQARLLKEFIIRRLHEEKDKDNGTYTCLNGNGMGMHYWDHIESALDPIFTDIEYLVSHPEILREETKSINDYDSVEQALNNLHRYNDGYVLEVTFIINGNITVYPILPCALDNNLSNKIRNELKYKGLPYLEDVFSSNSYYINFFEDHRTLTIIIHHLGD